MRYSYLSDPNNSIEVLSYLPTETDRGLLDAGGISLAPFLEGNLATDLSISFWIKPFGETPELFFWRAPLDPTVSITSIPTTIATSLLMGNVGTSSNSYTLGSAMFADNRWYNVTLCLRAGSAAKLAISINGVRFGNEVSVSYAIPIVSSLNKMFFLRGFSGRVARVSIFGRYLEASSALSVYGSGVSGQLSELISPLYDFIMKSDKVTLNTASELISDCESEAGWTLVPAEGVGNSVSLTISTNGTTTATVLSGNIYALKAGMLITGTIVGTPTIASVNAAGGTITLSSSQTTSASRSITAHFNRWIIGSGDKYKGTKCLHVSPNGTSAGYTNIGGTKIYAYRDITVPADKTVLSFRAKSPGDGSSTDFLRAIIALPSFVPQSGTAYTATIAATGVTYNDARILKMGARLIHSNSFNGSMAMSADKFKEYLMDLSEYAGMTVRLVFAFECDSLTNSAWGCAVDEVVFRGKHIIQGTKYRASQYENENRLDPSMGSTTSAINQAGGNQWFVSDELVLGSVKRLVYITPASSGSYTANYDNTVASWSHFVIDLNITDSRYANLCFKALVNTSDSADYLSVKVVDRSTLPLAGSPYNVTPIASIDTINTNPTWREHYIDLSSYYAAVDSGMGMDSVPIRVVFTWRNDSSGGSGLGARVTDIKLTSNGPNGGYVKDSAPAIAELICQEIELSDDKP